VIHLYQAQCRILPDLASDKGAVVDTGAQRGAAKYSSEIIASTGRNHKMIGALGHAKTLPDVLPSFFVYCWLPRVPSCRNIVDVAFFLGSGRERLRLMRCVLRTIRNDAHPRTFRTLVDFDYRDTRRLDCRDAPPPPRMFWLLSRAANVRARAYAHGRVRVCVCVCAYIGLQLTLCIYGVIN